MYLLRKWDILGTENFPSRRTIWEKIPQYVDTAFLDHFFLPKVHRISHLISLYVLMYCRNYVQSGFCMEEFNQAYQQVIEGKLSYIIIVLLQRPMPSNDRLELETYLKTHTYIDAQNDLEHIETIRKRIRFAMPKIPLKVLQVGFLSTDYRPRSKGDNTFGHVRPSVRPFVCLSVRYTYRITTRWSSQRAFKLVALSKCLLF